MKEHKQPTKAKGKQNLQAQLWCIALTPVREKLKGYQFNDGSVLAVSDDGTETFETVRQRLALWTRKAAAAKWARKHNSNNQFWRASVRPARIVE